MSKAGSRERSVSVRKASQDNSDRRRDKESQDVPSLEGSENVFGTMGAATDFFAAPTYREYQCETIEEVESAFLQGYRFVVIDAPTGSGKSHVARAFAFQAANTHILTIQKLLQDQYCVAPGARVLTEDLRWVDIGSLKVGDQLLAFDEDRTPNRRNWRRSTVESVARVFKACCRLTFSNGTEIVCSTDHLWLTGNTHNPSGWISTNKMRAGRHFRATKISKVVDVWSENRSWDGGFLSAAFDGEGHLSQQDKGNGADVNLVFSQKHNVFFVEVKCALDRQGFDYTFYKSRRDGCCQINISGRSEILRFLGSIRPSRLLGKFCPDVLGMINPIESISLVNKVDVGVREVVALRTSTHTFVVEGIASHNCNDFPEMFVMKGRSAYLCKRSGDSVSCAEGPCRRRKIPACDDCPYRLAKAEAMESAVIVHNFDSFYYQNAFGHGYGGRKLLIIDEAHNISSKYSEFLSFTINSDGGIAVPEGKTLEDYDQFVRYAFDEYKDELMRLEEQKEYVELTRDRMIRYDELGKLCHKMQRYLDEREKDKPAEYVFDYEKEGRWAPKVTFRPVFVGDYVRRHLFAYGERVIMMSATILNKEMFCEEIGLNPDEVFYIQVPSTFPAKNRPIIRKYAGKMGYRDIDKTLPKIASLVQEIADRFPGRKGIVQTHSEKIAGYLKGMLADPRFTFNKDYYTPQDMLEIHSNKEGSIIIASGLREGLDLRGDLSKIQIFCKVPYPSLGDKVVRRKMELSERWYGWITAVMFVQALGRSVRSKTERAVTYILDSDFGYFYHKNKRFIPKYVQEALVWGEK